MHRWASVRAVHSRLERAHNPRAQTDVPAPLLAQGDGGIGARAPGLGGAARTPRKPAVLSNLRLRYASWLSEVCVGRRSSRGWAQRRER